MDRERGFGVFESIDQTPETIRVRNEGSLGPSRVRNKRAPPLVVSSNNFLTVREAPATRGHPSADGGGVGRHAAGGS